MRQPFRPAANARKARPAGGVPRRLDATGAHVIEHLLHAFTAHRWAEGEQGVKNRAESIDVAARIDGFVRPTRLLWRHEMRGADERVGRCHRGVFLLPHRAHDSALDPVRVHRALRSFFVDDFGEPPIHHQHFAKVADHDVRRLQVAVDDALRVRESNGVADFLEERQQPCQWEALERGGIAERQLFQHVVQGGAFHELHRVENLVAFIHPELMHRDDVRMLELRGDLCLFDEAQQIGFRLAGELHFHGDRALRGEVAGAEDHAHATLRDRRADRIFALTVKLFRQQPSHSGSLGRERVERAAGKLATAHLQRDRRAELHLLAGEKPRATFHPSAIDECAGRAAEILDEDLVVMDGKLSVLPRHGRIIHLDVGTAAADHVVSRGDQPLGDHPAISSNGHLGFGNVHKSRCRGQCQPACRLAPRRTSTNTARAWPHRSLPPPLLAFLELFSQMIRQPQNERRERERRIRGGDEGKHRHVRDVEILVAFVAEILIHDAQAR